MRAAWYEQRGDSAAVLIVGHADAPQPGAAEVRIQVHVSGINPGDVKKRAGAGTAMPFPRVIPHSDGAGIIDTVGPGVASGRIGERVWCFGAQSYRPFGTAAEFVVVPEWQAIALPEAVTFEQGACLGIPGITAHRAVFADGPVTGLTVLVTGAAGAVGSMATSMASWSGAHVLAIVRHDDDVERARLCGAEHVFLTGDHDLSTAIRAAAPDGVDRIVDVAFGEYTELHAGVIAQGGVIATYASADPEPQLAFWPLLFQNTTIRLLGSDDFPREAKRQAARDINACLQDGLLRTETHLTFTLDQIAAAHEAVEQRAEPGRTVLQLSHPAYTYRRSRD